MKETQTKYGKSHSEKDETGGKTGKGTGASAEVPGGSQSGARSQKSELESKEFLELLKNHDSDAYHKLVNAYQNRIYNLALKLLRNAEDAEEILQETFLSIFDKIHTFEGRSLLSTWIYSIASNAALSRLRKKSEQSVTFQDEETLNISNAWFRNSGERFQFDKNDPLVLGELQERLNTAIESLPDGYREIFIMKELEKMPIKEIAPVFGINPGAVKTRLHRARLLLRARLSDYWNEEKS